MVEVLPALVTVGVGLVLLALLVLVAVPPARRAARAATALRGGFTERVAALRALRRARYER